MADLIAPNFLGDRATSVACPRCGFEGLHHTEVVIYDRAEDRKTCVRTAVNSGQVSVDPVASNSGNPSSRRHGLTIQFVCEGCGDAPILLTIAQHKGTTEMGWTFQHVPEAERVALYDREDG